MAHITRDRVAIERGRRELEDQTVAWHVAAINGPTVVILRPKLIATLANFECSHIEIRSTMSRVGVCPRGVSELPLC